MKRIAFIAVVLMLSSGCRGGLLSNLFNGGIFRGDSCRGNCGYALPAAPAPVAATTGCSDCGTVGTSYGSYDVDYYNGGIVSSDPIISSGPIVSSGTPVYEGTVVDGGTYYNGSTISPPMESIPNN